MYRNVPVVAVTKCENLDLRSHACLRDPTQDMELSVWAYVILKDTRTSIQYENASQSACIVKTLLELTYGRYRSPNTHDRSTYHEFFKFFEDAAS